jgi:hypothetical protein
VAHRIVKEEKWKKTEEKVLATGNQNYMPEIKFVEWSDQSNRETRCEALPSACDLGQFYYSTPVDIRGRNMLKVITCNFNIIRSNYCNLIIYFSSL